MLTQVGRVPGVTSPRRSSPMPPDERREMIVRAALPLCRERGNAVTSKQIAEAAGVSEGTIFNVFDDKDDVFRAVVAAAVDRAPTEAAIAAIDPDLGFDDQLVAATAVIQRRLVEIWQIVSQFPEHHHRPDGPRPRFGELPALTEMMARNADRLCVDPSAAAHLLGALTLALSHPMMSPEPSTPATIVDRFLHGCERSADR